MTSPVTEPSGSGGSGAGGDGPSLPILEAKHVYILMSKDHRISRNRRAEWFFSRFQSLVTLPKDTEITSVEESGDFHVVSAIPSDPPSEWSPVTRHSYRYRITTKTIVTYLSRRYRIVYCIDVSPSVAAVDVQAGTVVFDRIFQALRSSLDGLMRPFFIPGSTTIFQPKIFITVITHSPFIASVDDEVILQGKLLAPSTYGEILTSVFERLNSIENKMAEMTSSLLHKLNGINNENDIVLFDGDEYSSTPSKSSIAVSSDFSLVDLLKQALIALSLLPENSSSGLVILTDGVVSVPDGRYLDIILSQLRYNTVSCSFIQLSSPFHPHLCHGALPYADLMRFIASATFGAFLTDAPEIIDSETTEMNVYHQAFLAWSFQSTDHSQSEPLPPVIAKPGEWSIRNKCFFTVRDMPIVKKQQYENSLAVDYMKVLSCRLREGFMIKEISLTPDGQYEIKLTLPWKFLIHLEYVLVTNKDPQSKVQCILSLEGPYDFLHDVTCLAGRAFPSFYRQLMVNRFWATRKNLSESDRLLVHLNSFSSNSAYYNIPDSLRNGVPLFYFSANTTSPVLQSSDFPYPQFAQFWKPVCMLDTTVWQKWMHTHRIGIILEHDHPLPKHLHFPNSTGRFHVILCRQAVMALNTLLKDMSSFVLVENHSYVTLMYSEDEKIPFSFYIIRVTSKPPYVVLRLAFLVGTPGNLRHQTVSVLRGKIGSLTFPQRLKEPPKWRFPTNLNPQASEQSNKATWSDMPCCILMQKMIEKILIRYEKVPGNFCKVLMSQSAFESVVNQKSSASKQSTFGFRPTHPNPLAATTIMVPEMFNTVARYLHHRRWIWKFPKSALPNLCLTDGSEILSTVTKIRLQEGFRFAYSSAGTVSMVIEVQMRNETCRASYELSDTLNQPTTQETYFTPCVVQFVVFPPVTSLTGNFEGDSDAIEDMFFITECWVEPQCGSVSSCPFSALNDLQFQEIPNKIFEINQECFLTLGTFEYLRGICKNEDPDYKTPDLGKSNPQKIKEARLSHQGSIRIIPFEFELGRVLPKCQQSEILFSMFFQDLSQAFSVEKDNQFLPFHERANELLHNTWSSNLAFIHDKEINVESKHFEEILKMVLSREEDNTERLPDTLPFPSDMVPAWRCFVRAVDSSQLLITLMPKTLRDTKLLFMSLEKIKSDQNVCSTALKTERFPLNPRKDSVDDTGTDFSWINEKNRSRKNSEPNCNIKLGSASLAASLALEVACINGGRKRIRARSGGDSAPVYKKAFRVQCTFNEIFCHTFDENSSKYIVPKDGKPIFVEDLQSSDVSDQPESHLDVPIESSTNKDCLDKEEDKASIDTNQFMIGSLTMPLFVYDCSLSCLRDHVIFKGSSVSSEITDACFDFRIFKVDDGKNDLEFTSDDVESPSRSSDCTSQIPKLDTQEIPVTEAPEMSLNVFCKELQLAFKSSYIRSVFESLQLGYYVSLEDLRAVIKLCHKDTVQIDISEFMKCVCMHLSSTDNESCFNMAAIHEFIKRKFQDILSKDFNIQKVDSNLFFFKGSRSHRIYENSFNIRSNSEGIPSTSYFEAHVPMQKPFVSSELSDSDARRESEDKDSASNIPLFMSLKLSVYSAGAKKSVLISDLPICIDHFDTNMIQDILDQKDTDLWKIKLELMFLTSPNKASGNLNDVPVDEDSVEKLGLPHYETEVLKNVINEVQWLLDDEITSFRSKSDTLTAEILKDIAHHVERSAGKLGCFQQCIHLKFVNDAQVQGHDNFIERFNNLSVDGHALKKLENWWYLMETASSLLENRSISMEKGSDDVFLDSNHSLTKNSPQPSTKTSPSQSTTLNIQQETDESVENDEKFRPEEVQIHSVLPFWMIFRVEQDQVVSYCHCRYNENDLAPLHRCTEVRERMLNAVVGLIRIVNQDLLLQSLHDSRICSVLLESDNVRQSQDDSITTLFSEGTLGLGMRTESDIESHGGHNIPGMFSCDVVWETTFKLHPRLRSGPGKSAFSRGIQILRSTLIAFEVSNRENMFVYRDSNGNVFYLRLYRVYETLEDIENEIPSENPSPRSSISSRSRATELAERQNKEDTIFGILQAPPTGPRDRVSDGVVLLKVHGVTNAGKEIKEDLIQSLRNKLDDAVLDVLSVTLDRNPHCKLTPEDVHFIQKPNSSPDAVFKFTTGRFTKLLLPAFAFYLHQNLLQFLNIPKYTRQETEFHFQDFLRIKDGQTLEEQNVYLYNQSPGGTGSRGVACVAVALIDKSGSRMHCHDWRRPSDFRFSLAMEELSTFILTQEVINDNQSSDVMVELCVWKQGRINLEILKTNFCSAITHGGWDLAMEFQILTPPLRVEGKNNNCMENSTTSDASVSSCPDKRVRRRNSSVSQVEVQKSQVEEELCRGRSWSYTGGRNPRSQENEKPIEQLASTPLSPIPIGNAISTQTIKSNLDLRGKKTRRGYREDFQRLHPNYGILMKRWCSLGVKLNIPSLRMVTISLKPRHYLDETVTELGRIISAVASDNVITQFWKLDRSMREFLTIGDSIHPGNKEIIDQIHKEALTLKAHDVKLQSLEENDESEYPEELLSLFRTKAHFKPSDANIMCVLIARNITHWQTCVFDEKSLDPSFNVPEVMKSIYKFSPMISDPLGSTDDKVSLNAEKIRLNGRKGLLALITETTDDSNCMLVPRQRFLLATVSKTSIEFLFYNWSKESSDRLAEQTKLLAQWTQSRMQVLSSVLLQKSGLFYNQPFLRHSRIQDHHAPAFGGADIRDVILSPSPVKQSMSHDRSVGKKNLGPPSRFTVQGLCDIYRNLHHSHLQCYSNDLNSSPIKTHGEQTLCLLNSGKREVENSLFRVWLKQGPSASNVIGMEAIEAFKQAARTIHYCMTPIIFLPRWRNAVALTRDSTVGVFKRARIVDTEKSTQAKLVTIRSRSVSGNSDQSVRVNSNLSKSPIWSVWKRTYASGSHEQEWSSAGSLSRTLKKTDESWHLNLCETFLQEYRQYLNTLGFIPTHNTSSVTKRKQPMLTSETWTASYVGRLERVRRMSDGSVLSSESESSFTSRSPTMDSQMQRNKLDIDEKIYYLQRSLPGGIILLEVGLAEPFCYCKIHALEAHRIQQSKGSRKSAASKNMSLSFLDECDKMKVLMHLHSFAYDFHLRWLHSYICGKQLIFKQGYHLTKFIDDFISYYCKGPNFARNTVHLGVVTLQNMSTPSHILFNYILSHDKIYKMKVIRMIPLNSNKNLDFLDPLLVNEYILVYSLSKKVVYKQSEDENYFDEFDMSLMIAHDSPLYVRPYSVDPSVLRMKYYIVLTSRRELYPKVVSEPGVGKLYPVTTPEPLCGTQGRLKNPQKPTSKVIDEPIEPKIVARENSPNTHNTDKEHTSKDAKPSSSDDVGPHGIREENIRYMGYFSSHEQMMQQIVKEQTEWAEDFIRTVVGKAAVDCRRDLLWQRLLVGGKFQEKFKKKKEDLTIRETVGVLSYWEFSELLELVRVEPLRKMDSRLKILLKQPISFFQSLIKLLTYGSQYQHRHFTAPDGSVHQLTIINPNMNKSVVMVEMNLEKPSCDLSVVFKEFNETGSESSAPELDTEILNLIESTVSACCYCDWMHFL